MYCQKCGKESSSAAQLCESCGTRFATQQRQPLPTEHEGGPPAPKRGRGLSIASLVLGLAGLGLPALILGIIALVQRYAGRGMAIAGVVLGAIETALSVVLLIGVVSSLTIPKIADYHDQSRQTAVKMVMRDIQVAMETYAAEHDGNYPPGGQDLMACFPGGIPATVGSEPVPGDAPANPYSGSRYALGRDLLYLVDALSSPEENRKTEKFGELAAPEGCEGTVVVMCHTEPKSGTIDAYAITGYGRDTASPMAAYDPDGNPVYLVLHN